MSLHMPVLVMLLLPQRTDAWVAALMPAPVCPRAAVRAVNGVPPMIDGFPAMMANTEGLVMMHGTMPQLWEATPDWTSALLTAATGALATGAISAGYTLMSQSSSDDQSLCVMVDMPSVERVTDKDWWLCPGARLDDGDCREVYYEGEYTVACAY
eukprot:CAMPEP_0119074632 /NCGR_PEP_ID=MMETSP1178-20130426/72237_1 /TAXON_ID=33656 /ORGANISM="unid sp, Strain CCMP2000" /LENGTH=154 /DNA_ID=CAMNT_0007056801 /DNA_START=21 /DNA_END=485 /DNA_ORIENTATION=+